MRCVKFAKHLAEHLGKVEVVVDIWQESLVGLALGLPIHSMQIYIIELVLHLTPNMVEEILPLLVWLHIEPCLEVDVLSGAVAEVDLLDTAIAQIHRLAFLVHIECTVSHTLGENPCVSLAQVLHPQVVTSLKTCHIIEFFAVLGKYGITETRRVVG